uniref:Surfeit locus protein 2 n=1 Tax=Kalanchoe fedtschenkoi TaxID=63787 RepID=A0A7N0TRB3_KALFE
MAEADGAKKKKKKKQPQSEEREGKNLLGSPTYTELSNGRFKCVETGHELSAAEMESYSQSKRCRLGLIEFSLKMKKPPVNMFKRDPNSSSKLICKLTGDIINKSEEHIWKHLNGKQFLNKLEQKEMGKLELNGTKAKTDGDEKLPGKENGESDDKKKRKKKKDKKKKKKKKVSKEVDEGTTEASELPEKNNESEEIDFWVPPVGSRWDNDEGGDRWGSDSDSGEDDGEGDGDGNDEVEDIDEVFEPEELTRKKRPSDDLEPSSCASTKKHKENEATQ